MEGVTSGTDELGDQRIVAPYVAAGLTWWVEKLGWFRGELPAMRARILAGPPT